MNKLKKITLTLTILFFTACGTETDNINPDLGFDMWDYMTTTRNYEVEYDVYENGQKTDYYVETHRQFGETYERESENGLTRIILNSNKLLKSDPNGENTSITRFTHLKDDDIFQSPKIQHCSLEKFYDNYQSRGTQFYNIIQVNCRYKSGFYQEFYYGYNEGIVHIYENDNGTITEYLKVKEKEIN